MSIEDAWTTPTRGVWQKIITQSTTGETSNEFEFPQYTKRLYLKVEYGNTGVTAQQSVYLKDSDDVWHLGSEVTPAFTNLDEEIVEAGYYHGATEFSTGEMWNLDVEGEVSVKVTTAAQAAGVSVWIMCV
jgi:hypothetical protein